MFGAKHLIVCVALVAMTGCASVDSHACNGPDRCPPGLAKKGGMPPGQAKKHGYIDCESPTASIDAEMNSRR